MIRGVGTEVEVLIPTYQRPTALAVTLTALCFQSHLPRRIIIADQGAASVADVPEIRAVAALLHERGVATDFVRNLPRQGMAQQRQLLLDCSETPHILFLDDDVITEPWLLALLSTMLADAGCGLVGSAVLGLGWIDDHRPDEQAIEFWQGAPKPECIGPGDARWQRHLLHNAANLLHVQRRLRLTPATPRLYKVAWIGGCVMYDRAALVASGGFDFWERIPAQHAGEDVYAQLRVMARRGGAGLIPSGAYHQELATTVPDREFDVPRRLPLPSAAGRRIEDLEQVGERHPA